MAGARTRGAGLLAVVRLVVVAEVRSEVFHVVIILSEVHLVLPQVLDILGRRNTRGQGLGLKTRSRADAARL